MSSFNHYRSPPRANVGTMSRGRPANRSEAGFATRLLFHYGCLPRRLSVRRSISRWALRLGGIYIAKGAAWIPGAFVSMAIAVQAQPIDVSCVPPGAEICRVIATQEFLTVYSNFYSRVVDPEDAVDNVRFNMRSVLTGSGQAGPAAVGSQVDMLVDDALRRAQQQFCGGTLDSSRAISAVAAGLADAALARGVRLTGEALGLMTGSLLGSTRPRGAACLCAARTLDGIRSTCSPSALQPPP
jgi:hypothetical protein